MLSVNGIYDGKSVKITDRITKKRKYKVVVTFIEELPDDSIRDFSAQISGLEFWEDSQEDIYQDYLTSETTEK